LRTAACFEAAWFGFKQGLEELLLSGPGSEW
jgi:hypothetical protein